MYIPMLKAKTLKMKFTGFFFMLFLLNQLGIAQSNNFAPIGATWYYSDIYDIDYDDTIYITGYNMVESVADTIIEGIACRKLKFTYIDAEGNLNPYTNYHYLYEDSDKVFCLIEDNFKLIYDFSGDNWYAHDILYETGDSVLMEVDSVTMELYDGVLLKTIHTRTNFDGNFYYISNKIVEKMGPLCYLFLYSGTDDSHPPSGLRCYNEDAISIQISAAISCDSLTPEITSIGQVENEFGIQVYPNPTSSELYVQVSNLANNIQFSVLIFDLTGKLLREINVDSDNSNGINKMDINSLPNGLFIAQIKSNGEIVNSFKIIKE